MEAAAYLLRDEGPGAVTTRGVAQAAGVQAPAIYRLFGDKDGLLEAVAEHVMAAFVADKASAVAVAAAADVDPVQELTDGWRRQIEFGLANPALFALLSDPRRVAGSPAARSGKEVLATASGASPPPGASPCRSRELSHSSSRRASSSRRPSPHRPQNAIPG